MFATVKESDATGKSPVAHIAYSQVQRLEASLGQAQQKIDELESRLSQQKEGLGAPDPISPFREYHVSLTEAWSHEVGLELPPRQKVLFAVDTYLKALNAVLPLFHPQRLLRCINGWYEHPDRRDTSTWATVNVVLALAHRHIPIEETMPGNSTVYFLNNAQSALNEVIMGKSRLLDVQTLVGMVLLFQATLDLKPAATLIAVALRLAHELGLHTRSSSEQLSSSEALERDRVFWIAYILDRDIAMRTNLPPVQRESDISIDWPPAAPTDEAGLVFTTDGSHSFNFFLSRVQLAHIQGEVYETMGSISPPTLDAYVRLENVARVHRMLDDWFARIPLQFRPNAIVQAGEMDLYRPFGVLYSTHLKCRSLICEVHVMESRWLQTLQGFSRKAAQEGVVTPPNLPAGWQELVYESREYMRLFMHIEQKDPAFVWMTACTYILGSICLTANTIFNPLNPSRETDNYLADLAFTFLEDMIQQVPLESLQRTRDSWDELLRHARALPLQVAA
ncbi:hypothetical protein FSARC_4304 [Fusarium sarcochroum]|uniref:Xylanolytic transcriptional activator regulatory domain-containing protein n=1 Tax=Fusarium sarcochroum TaxID=1208366 RepID=A0A8H4XAU8_9HYPO|nr:hypothetical protein FSARC_4304 [Fusarium sarcochroum]